VIKAPIPFTTVDPRHQLGTPWDAPFLFADSRHVFYITTAESRIWIPGHRDFGIGAEPWKGLKDQPPLVFQRDPDTVIGPKYWGDGGPVGPDPTVVDPESIRQYVTEDVNILQGIGMVSSVKFGEKMIGPSGTKSKTATNR